MFKFENDAYVPELLHNLHGSLKSADCIFISQEGNQHRFFSFMLDSFIPLLGFHESFLCELKYSYNAEHMLCLFMPDMSSKVIEHLIFLVHEGYCICENLDELKNVESYAKNKKIESSVLGLNESWNSNSPENQTLEFSISNENFLDSLGNQESHDSFQNCIENFEFEENSQQSLPDQIIPSQSVISDFCSKLCTSNCGNTMSTWTPIFREEILKQFGKENKSFQEVRNGLVQHLKSQHSLGLSTDDYHLNGLKLCIGAMSEVTGLSSYILKSVLRDFSEGFVFYKHNNTSLMKSLSIQTVGFISWLKKFSEFYGQSGNL